jgi:hypothetical protein
VLLTRIIIGRETGRQDGTANMSGCETGRQRPAYRVHVQVCSGLSSTAAPPAPTRFLTTTCEGKLVSRYNMWAGGAIADLQALL